jgi:hypothetical protein
MKRFLGLACLVFMAFLAAHADIVVKPGSAGEGGRFALIIANSKYRAPLRTPGRDAEDIGAALEGLGYRVTVRLDADLGAMTQAVGEFAALLSENPGSEGFFWFAGQGAELDGRNYLLPAGVDPDADIAAASYGVGALLYRLDGAGNKANVVMLDACFSRISSGETHRGLEAVFASKQAGSKDIGEMSGDIFYMQSAWPGGLAFDSLDGGRNSPFAAAFLETLGKGEPLALLAADIIRETAARTSGRQKPYCLSYLLRDKTYALYRR